MTDEEAHEFYKNPENLRITGPARKPSRPPKTAMIAVRFDPATIEAVKRLTDGTAQTVSSWIRDAVRREEYRQRVKWLDAHRHELEVVPGSGRMVEPRALRSSLSAGTRTGVTGTGRTFSCPHMSVGNVTSAACWICGPLSAVA